MLHIGHHDNPLLGLASLVENNITVFVDVIFVDRAAIAIDERYHDWFSLVEFNSLDAIIGAAAAFKFQLLGRLCERFIPLSRKLRIAVPGLVNGRSLDTSHFSRV